MAKKSTTPENPLERKTDPMRAEGTTTLTVLGVLMTIASVISLNPILIGASIVLLFLFSIAASSLQRSENMETYLRDIRDALNLQTERLDSIYRQMVEVEGARRVAEEIEEKVGELRDIGRRIRRKNPGNVPGFLIWETPVELSTGVFADGIDSVINDLGEPLEVFGAHNIQRSLQRIGNSGVIVEQPLQAGNEPGRLLNLEPFAFAGFEPMKIYAKFLADEQESALLGVGLAGFRC